MTIKDFATGQIAYGLQYRWVTGANYAQERQEVISEYRIEKIGKKYIYAAEIPGSYVRKFEMYTEYAVIGGVKLFPSRQAISDWKEAEELRTRLGHLLPSFWRGVPIDKLRIIAAAAGLTKQE